eukprot:2544074-Amphidinium_carterae.1
MSANNTSQMEAPCAKCLGTILKRTRATTAMILGNFPAKRNSLGAAWLIRRFPLIHPRRSRVD